MRLPWCRWYPRHRTDTEVVPWGMWLWSYINDSEGVFLRIVGLELFWRHP
jgi:hypothetical protein